MKNLQVGKLFVLILIFIDRFSKGKNPEISEELEKLKNSVEYRTKYI